MGNIYLNIAGPSGVTYVATVERLADGYYREDDAETFGTGLAFVDKDITMAEGTGENRGSYSATLDGSTWNDGLYRFRAHQGNRVDGTIDFGVMDGNEVSVGETVPIYHHDIHYIKDSTGGQDEYRANFFKNGVWNLTASGVTITVVNAAGSAIINGEVMTEIGSTGTFLYTTSTAAKMQASGEAYSVAVAAVIDSDTRTFPWILGRDS